MADATCRQCGVTFDPHWGGPGTNARKLCSPECVRERQLAQGHQREHKPHVRERRGPAICRRCGKQFDPYWAGGSARALCSTECARERQLRQMREYYEPSMTPHAIAVRERQRRLREDPEYRAAEQAKRHAAGVPCRQCGQRRAVPPWHASDELLLCHKCRADETEEFNDLARSVGLSIKGLRAFGFGIDHLRDLIAEGVHCSICSSDQDLCLDHDHRTGLFRGLLCQRCNSGFGRLGDTRARVLMLLAYLNRAEARSVGRQQLRARGTRYGATHPALTA